VALLERRKIVIKKINEKIREELNVIVRDALDRIYMIENSIYETVETGSSYLPFECSQAEVKYMYNKGKRM